jgi:hypothetical protein
MNGRVLMHKIADDCLWLWLTFDSFDSWLFVILMFSKSKDTQIAWNILKYSEKTLSFVYSKRIQLYSVYYISIPYSII